MNEEYIKEFILDNKLISNDDLKKVEEKMFSDNLNFLSAVIEANVLDQHILEKILEFSSGLQKIELKNKLITFETLSLIPEPIARKEKIISFYQDENLVKIAIAGTEISYDFLRNLIPKKYEIEVYLADLNEIKEKLLDYQKLLKENFTNKVQKNIQRIKKISEFASSQDSPEFGNYLREVAEDHYSMEFLKQLLDYAIQSQATNIYFDAFEDKSQISFRINGDIFPVLEIEAETIHSVALKLKYLADINILDEEKIIQEAHLKLPVLDKQEQEIFVSFINTVAGESISIEILNTGEEFGQDFLVVDKKQEEILYRKLNLKKGFYLISGEEKSGKTKTIYSLAEYEIQKNKEAFIIEDLNLKPVKHAKHIVLEEKNKADLVLPKIIHSTPDFISIENIKSYSLKILFDFVSFGGKVVLGIKNFDRFIQNILELKFPKEKITSNFKLLLEHHKFKKNEQMEKTKISKKDLNILNQYISETEILDLFQRNNLIKAGDNLKNIILYKAKKTKKIKDFTDWNYVRGVLDLENFFEENLWKENDINKIKINLKKSRKKVILENALILSNQKIIDYNEILNFLKK